MTFGHLSLLIYIDELKQTHGNLGQFHGLEIKDGIQVLWKKAYHLTDYTIENNCVVGLNGFGEKIELELDVTRPIIYNKFFYCFKNLYPHAYALFPYRKNNKTPISITEMKVEFPKAYNYIIQMKERIKSKVQHFDNDEYWHKFTCEHNHDTYLTDKIIFPMTAKDTITTCSIGRDLYMDNANVWFIKINGADSNLLKAVCAMINSTIFSVLAKAKANPQSGGYYKLNKQFLLPVPFPSESLMTSQDSIYNLASINDEVDKLQEMYFVSTPSNKENIKALLTTKWLKLDEICYEMYGLSESQKQLIETEGRTISHLDLLNEVM